MSDEARLVHVNAALNVSPQYIPLVGVPTHWDHLCNRSHLESTVCVHCRWNSCQNCGSRCGTGFTGWTKLCPSCDAHSSFTAPIIPDEWKTFYPSAQGSLPSPSSAAGSQAVVIIADEEDEPSERDRLKKELPLMPDTWEIPASGEVRDYATFTLYDTTVSIAVDPKYAVEIYDVLGRLLQARDKRPTATDFLPPSFSSTIPPPNFRIVQLMRVQCYTQLQFYRTAVEIVTIRNTKRAAAERASVIEATAFHGTNFRAALSVTEHGSLMTRCEIGAFGKGFYVSLGSIALPLIYSLRNAARFQDTAAFVMGSCIVGRNSLTHGGQDIPNSGCDTGGCGSSWIHTIFDKNHFNAEYIIVHELATQEVWDEQVKHFEKAFDLATRVTPSAPVIVIPSTPPPDSQSPSSSSGKKVARKPRKSLFSHKKAKTASAGGGGGGKYKPTPPTSEEDSSDDKKDKNYKPGARPRK
jgi:hypothetical protein